MNQPRGKDERTSLIIHLCIIVFQTVCVHANWQDCSEEWNNEQLQFE